MADSASGAGAEPRPGAPDTRNRLLAIITVILVLAALRAAETVLLPLALALFVIALVWPIQTALETRMPRWLAVILTVLVVLAAFGILLGAIVWSLHQLAERAPDIAARARELRSEVTGWLRTQGIPLAASPSDRDILAGDTSTYVRQLATRVTDTLTMLGIVLAYLVLGLLEVRDFETKVEHRLRRRLGDHILDTAAEVTRKVRGYMVAIGIASAISGAVATVFLLIMGVDLALLWGLLTFLLNFIPTVGPFLSVLPPTAYAILQFDGLTTPLVVFLGTGAIQFLTGNFIDPKITGRVLSISPIVILAVVFFWGWMWGVVGALLAVPITATALIICSQFESTRWIAALLAGVRARRETTE